MAEVPSSSGVGSQDLQTAIIPSKDWALERNQVFCHLQWKLPFRTRSCARLCQIHYVISVSQKFCSQMVSAHSYRRKHAQRVEVTCASSPIRSQNFILNLCLFSLFHEALCQEKKRRKKMEGRGKERKRREEGRYVCFFLISSIIWVSLRVSLLNGS